MEKLAVVIPCYRVKNLVLSVIEKIDPNVAHIFVVDDCCPEQTGKHVTQVCRDPRVEVVFLEKNQGVGGATLAGFKKGLAVGATIAIKLDGDGQMDPRLIPQLIRPLLDGQADYTKGNRFFSLELLRGMPLVRLFGNSMLSLLTKFSSGYWGIMDPTNGFTAIRTSVLALLPLDKIDRSYFFESDMLCRLNLLRAVVADVPMRARYENEPSSLRIWTSLFSFSAKHVIGAMKRIFYSYFLRDFNPGSLQLLFGSLFTFSGMVFGILQWREAYWSRHFASSGQVMLASLPIILGFQMLL